MSGCVFNKTVSAVVPLKNIQLFAFFWAWCCRTYESLFPLQGSWAAHASTTLRHVAAVVEKIRKKKASSLRYASLGNKFTDIRLATAMHTRPFPDLHIHTQLQIHIVCIHIQIRNIEGHTVYAYIYSASRQTYTQPQFYLVLMPW